MWCFVVVDVMRPSSVIPGRSIWPAPNQAGHRGIVGCDGVGHPTLTLWKLGKLDRESFLVYPDSPNPLY